jgi:hypothetical protein
MACLTNSDVCSSKLIVWLCATSWQALTQSLHAHSSCVLLRRWQEQLQYLHSMMQLSNQPVVPLQVTELATKWLKWCVLACTTVQCQTIAHWIKAICLGHQSP